MPELPEVEAMKNQLGIFLTRHKITSVTVNNRKTFQGNEKNIIGKKIVGTRRFGKVTSIDLSEGYSILAHVKLTGQFIYRGPNLKSKDRPSPKVIGGVPGPHTLVIFKLDRSGTLYYNDVRRFGWIRIIKTDEIKNEKYISKLGPEFLKDLTLEKFKSIISTTKRPIKVVIMDQTKMGGVGNIYATDALWEAKINPKTPANKLDTKTTGKLFDAIEYVLKEGIKYGGASELAFVTPDGLEGEYQDHTLAYGKEGTICKDCKKTKIEKYFLGGRGTYWCPNCQK